MVSISAEDMAEALQNNPLAMEQAKVAALLRENTTLKDEVEQLRGNLRIHEEKLREFEESSEKQEGKIRNLLSNIGRKSG